MKKLFFFLTFILTCNGYCQEPISVFDIARKGTVEQVKEKLKENPKSFHVVNDDGYSPLTLACYRGNNEVAKLLIETGSDIDGKSKMGTPLMASIVKGNNEMVKFLIDKKADLEFADGNGVTALIYAVQFQNKTALQLLIESKANKAHKDKEGKTAFEHAVFAGNQEIINLLK